MVEKMRPETCCMGPSGGQAQVHENSKLRTKNSFVNGTPRFAVRGRHPVRYAA